MSADTDDEFVAWRADTDEFVVSHNEDGTLNWGGVIAYGLACAPRFTWSTDENGNDTSILKYSGQFLPRIGTEVRVDMNQFGWCTVTGYFVEHGWLGVECRVHKLPKWYRDQCKRHGEDPSYTGHFFGIDLGAVRPSDPDRKDRT